MRPHAVAVDIVDPLQGNGISAAQGSVPEKHHEVGSEM